MDIVEYIKDYTTEEWETIPINIRMRLYSTGEYNFYKEDSIEAADEIERLRETLRLIVEHPVEQSQQWETAAKEMIRLAVAALKEGE